MTEQLNLQSETGSTSEKPESFDSACQEQDVIKKIELYLAQQTSVG